MNQSQVHVVNYSLLTKKSLLHHLDGSEHKHKKLPFFTSRPELQKLLSVTRQCKIKIDRYQTI